MIVWGHCGGWSIASTSRPACEEPIRWGDAERPVHPTPLIITRRDGWTLHTLDRSYAVAWKYTIALTDDQPIIVTAV